MFWRIFSIFVLFFTLGAGWIFLTDHPEVLDSAAISYEARSSENETAGPVSQKITLGFVGDIMLDRAVLSSDEKNGIGNLSFPFEKVKTDLQAYDILFGNLEGPISSQGVNLGSKYSFRMKPETAVSLSDAGFDVLSVANNHIGDWGVKAASDTFSQLNNVGIKAVGSKNCSDAACQPVIFEKKGVKIAYVAFSQFKDPSQSAALISEDEVVDLVSQAKSAADIVAVSFHFGEEYQKQPTEYQKKYARLAIDSGANIVIGHHPHVVQPMENYKDGRVVYSLGNFVFDQPFSEETMTGALAEAVISGGKVSDFRLVPVKINEFYQPEIIEE